MRDYILEKQKMVKAKLGGYKLYGVPVKVEDEINFDISKVLKKVESILPRKIFKGLVVIKIRDMGSAGSNLPFNAYYINKRLFINNKQEGVMDAVDDIIHEMSHHIEKQYGDTIYGDGRLQAEFIKKRKVLHDLLAANKLDPPGDLSTDFQYSKKIDNYLYNKVGVKLFNFLGGLFLNEYSATSLREYYGVGFEKYLIDYHSHAKMKKNNPVLFEKIKLLMGMIDEEDQK